VIKIGNAAVGAAEFLIFDNVNTDTYGSKSFDTAATDCAIHRLWRKCYYTPTAL